MEENSDRNRSITFEKLDPPCAYTKPKEFDKLADKKDTKIKQIPRNTREQLDFPFCKKNYQETFNLLQNLGSDETESPHKTWSKFAWFAGLYTNKNNFC